MADPYALLSETEGKLRSANYRHKRRIQTLADREALRIASLRLDLINLATDLHAGLPREKIGTSIQKILENLDA